MAYETVHAIRNLAIASTGWTDIQGLAVLPISCNTIFILNNSGQLVKFRTDPGNAASELDLQPGQEYSIGVDMFPPSVGWRFPLNGPPAGSLQSASGNANVLILSVL